MFITQTRAIDNARSILITVAGACLLLAGTALAADQDSAPAKKVKTVFYIDLENHNWTQPASETGPQHS